MAYDRQWRSMISADFPNRVPRKCDSNSMMGTPYPHPLHMIMSVTFYFYMYGVDFRIIPCGMRASTAAWWCCHLAPSSDPWFQSTFRIGSHKCDGNNMMGAIYPHSLHMKFVNDCLYVWSGRGNNSMWDQRYNPENPWWTTWWSCTHPAMPLVAIRNCHQHIPHVGNYWLWKHTHHQWWRPSLPSSRPPQHYPISPGSNYCWIRSGA